MNQPVSSTAAGSVGYALQAIGYPPPLGPPNTNLTNWFGRHIMGL